MKKRQPFKRLPSAVSKQLPHPLHLIGGKAGTSQLTGSTGVPAGGRSFTGIGTASPAGAGVGAGTGDGTGAGVSSVLGGTGAGGGAYSGGTGAA